jgi:DNA-binding response OmpR family regulator
MQMLQKPFSLESLTTRVREILQEKKVIVMKRTEARESVET